MLGYADARVPDSAPGCSRWCDAPLDEAVRLLVEHIRDFRPQILVTHDAYGGVTGHPDHVHTHRVAMLAATAAGVEQLYPEAGAPWRPSALYQATHPHSAMSGLLHIIGARRTLFSIPDEDVTARLDVNPWLDQKLAAILAHRTEVERGALPGLVASLAPDVCEQLLGVEWYTSPHAWPGGSNLTAGQ